MALELAVLMMLGVGLVIGMLGGGGSLLSVPILVYGLGMATQDAIVTGLAVVGVSSLLAAAGHARHGRIAWKSCFVYACVANPSAYAGGFVSKYIPDALLMLAFGLLMLFAAYMMTHRPKPACDPSEPSGSAQPIVGRWVLLAAPIGFMSGLLGTGGGFLVVPTLVCVVGMGMRDAVGSALVIVGLQCLAGLHGHLDAVDIDLQLTASLGAAMITGSFLGLGIARRLPQVALRRGFSTILALCGILVLYSEAAKLGGF